jgi:hypothetical protein
VRRIEFFTSARHGASQNRNRGTMLQRSLNLKESDVWARRVSDNRVYSEAVTTSTLIMLGRTRAMSSSNAVHPQVLQWFDQGCAAFTKTFPDAAAQIVAALGTTRFYVCPLCLGAFHSDLLAQAVLTREHAPPESVGGRRVALTCRGRATPAQALTSTATLV